MQNSPELGQYIRLLSSMQGFRRAIEIGVFTGYSALNLALALPDDGRIVACDINEDWTATARRYWQEAGVAHKISLRIAPATTTLEALIPIGRGSYDFVFIDADKETYDTYYEHALTLLRPGGIIALDNVFRGGRIANPAETGEDVLTLRALNQKIQTDPRVDFAIIPIGDGLTTVRKRG
jgi:caffeoyl-CoA O-methyltransferase